MNTAPFSCFGVPIEGTSLQDTIIRINEGRARWIVTVNPEILLEAKRDATYRDILRQADLRVADGFGVTCAAFVNGQHITRVTGVELAEKLLDEAVIHNWNVAFIGGEPGVAEKALATQQTQRPTLRGFALQGGKIGADGMGDDTDAEAIHQITMQAPDVVLVAFGHPKQERWIAKNLPTLPSVPSPALERAAFVSVRTFETVIALEYKLALGNAIGTTIASAFTRIKIMLYPSSAVCFKA